MKGSFQISNKASSALRRYLLFFACTRVDRVYIEGVAYLTIPESNHCGILLDVFEYVVLILLQNTHIKPCATRY